MEMEGTMQSNHVKLVIAIAEMKIVISLPVSITSKDHEWYYRSSEASMEKNGNFSNYYHWKRAAENSPFMSKYKNISYLHYRNRPDWPVLNWQSAYVQEHMFVSFTVSTECGGV